jgi:hypothetical protein
VGVLDLFFLILPEAVVVWDEKGKKLAFFTVS